MAAGFRELLLARGEPVDGVVLRGAVPVSLHRPGEVARGNRKGMLTVPLPVGEPDDIRRLRPIASETARRKRITRPAGGALFRNGAVQRAFLRWLPYQRVMNTYTANLPGPPLPLYFAGAPVHELFPIVAVSGNVPIGLGALSYAGQLNVSV